MIFPIEQQQRAIDSLRSKIGAVVGLRLAVSILAGWLLAWGVAVLALRGIWLVPREPLLWGLAGIGLAAAIGIIVALQRRPSIEVVRAVLDGRGRCGGLLMTSGAMEIGDWQTRISEPRMPTVRWRGKRQWVVLGASAAFVTASFLMPSRYLAPSRQPLEIGNDVARLEAKIDLLEEEKILQPEKAKTLEEALKQVEQQSAGNDPAKTWEALDHIEQAVAKAGLEAGEKTGRQAQQAAAAEELAAALDQAHEKISSEALAEAMKALAQQVQEATTENLALDEKLSEKLDQLKDAAEKGGLNEEQLKELAEALKECKAGDLKQLKKLADAKMIDAEDLKECEGGCEIDPDALAEILIKCKDGKDGKEGDQIAAILAELAGKPGRGGISRGPGAAAISWKDPSSKEDTEFKERVLPPGSIASVKDSRMRGVSAGAPTADLKPASGAGGALDGTVKAQGSAHTQIILPEHKGVVRRYFERSREK